MKAEGHLTCGDYRQLETGGLPPRRLLQQLHEHLLEKCPTCLREWERYCAEPLTTAPPAAAPKAAPLADFEGMIQRAVARARKLHQRIQRERADAEHAYRTLKGMPHQEDRVSRIRRSHRYQTLALCETLLHRSRSKSFHSPQGAGRRAELAIEVAWTLDRNEYSSHILADLLARGWALLANARRIGSDFRLAEHTFLMAEYFLRQGSGDPIVAAEVLDLYSSLRRDQRNFPEAVRLLSEVIRIYRRAGEEHLEGRAYLSLATVLGEEENHTRALAMAEKAIRRIDRERDPRLSLCAHHARTRLILKVGRAEEAREELARLAARYDTFPEQLIHLRRRWLEGEILEALGKEREAEKAFADVYEGFREVEIPFDAALAGLNLAALYLRQRRLRECRALLPGIVRVFDSIKIDRQATAAVKRLGQDGRKGEQYLEIIQLLSRYLILARRDPTLRFQAA